MTTSPKQGALSIWVKLAYGTGDWSLASFGTLRQVFYAIFLTDVVGLEPRLASFAALIGIIWDAVNDPIVGTLSDRVRSRWGRRRPFLLLFSIPFGLSFVALWWAPPFENQYLLAATVCLTFMLSDTLQTLVSIPFYALTPEMTSDYDERTSLSGYRMFFNLLASLATAVAAPAIVDAALASGATQQQGYFLVSALFGGLAVIPFFVIFALVRERGNADDAAEPEIPFLQTLRTSWENIPFRFATALYMLNWITFDLVALALPFFLAYWIAKGNLIQKALGLPLESAVFACLLVTSVIVLPFWVWLARKIGKQYAYIAGMAFWAVVQLLIFSIQPGQITYILVLAVMAGIGVSTAHVLPDAIFPDVIEWDELRTGHRREGIYYGVKNFVRKLTGALAIFIALQLLGWFGYQAPPAGASQFTQPASALAAIRFLIGPLGALLLFSAIAMAWFYPLTREKHARIQALLERKKNRVIAP
ncbi:MAG: glycoside-pentoside-hexuronide (GPH):cation symporter, partial [Chloroflexi bacterium]|nr:glycoside-pentoside-hexuronide (GPH):cation symporter [Chloroflexota bacterium]